MNYILILFAALFVISISPAYAQHHSGSLSPPIDLDGFKVAVSTTLFPEDFSYGDSKTTNLSIRFFDIETNLNIPSVTYRVQIFQDDNLVASEYFYDEDGTLDLTIKPTTGCLEKIFGNVPYTMVKNTLLLADIMLEEIHYLQFKVQFLIKVDNILFKFPL